MSRTIDHIVYCVIDLDQAIDTLEKKLGVKATLGGRHTSEGTKNALIHLGNKCYLEILAIDRSNDKITAPRWMGIEYIQEATVTRWAIKSDDIHTDSHLLSAYNNKMGKVTEGSRNMTNGKSLHWQIAMPLATPKINIVPFITDWSNSEAHPTDTLDHPCKLLELRLNHPNPTEIQNLFGQMDIDISINSTNDVSIVAVIQCPNGIIHL